MAPIQLNRYRITVLLVDDQPIIGQIVRQMLSSEKDIDFHVCQNPLHAIETANRILPTVILQDLVMPEMDGLRLVRYFRANKPTRDVPLIVLSAKEEPQIKAEAFSLGANDYMVKLPDALEVLARIRYHSRAYINFLERNEAFDALRESRKQLEIRNRLIRSTFGRYVSDEIVDQVLESPEGMNLGGERRKVTIMMTDLRGFTSITERLQPEFVVGMINTFLEVMTEIILQHNGTINEFLGDGVLVIFGAPLCREDDAVRAVACGVSMQLAMEEVNRRNREAGYPVVAMGIGINTGEVIVGNIGSRKRMKYSAVGRAVNLASRIESYTLGGQILISERTLKECGPILRIDDCKKVMPKGVKEPVIIYQIGGIGGDYNLHLPRQEDVVLIDLVEGLDVKFTILAGKHADMDGHHGKIIRMFDDAAEIHAETVPDLLENVKIALMNGGEGTGDLYAKVTGHLAGNDPGFKVNFTYVPPEAACVFEKAMAARRAGAASMK